MNRNPIMGVVYMFLSSYAIIAFCLIYDRAFDIPLNAKEVKRRVMMALPAQKARPHDQKPRTTHGIELGRNVDLTNLSSRIAFEALKNDPSERIWTLSVTDHQSVRNGAMLTMRDIKKVLRSFPRIGAKVGNFKYLERISTPDFLDFVTQSAVNLLIAFR